MEIDLRGQYSPLPKEETERMMEIWKDYKELVGGRLWGDILQELVQKNATQEEIDRRLQAYNKDREIASSMVSDAKKAWAIE